MGVLPKRVFSPAFILSWIGLVSLRLAVLLPYPTLMWFGRVLGWVMRKLSKYRRIIAATNLHLCFPNLDEGRRNEMLTRHFEFLGKSFFEMAACWWIPDQRLEGMEELSGLEHLKKALGKGKGVILLTGHFTSFEIGVTLLSTQQPLCVTYREFKNPLFHYFMLKGRNKHFERTIHRHDTRSFIRALKQNSVVWYAPDQDPGLKHSTFVPFFNVAASTLTATSRIASISGATVLPFTTMYTEGKSPYKITIHPPLENFPSGDLAVDAQAFNRFLENAILEAPEQYYWIHRRFKTRPKGESKFYPSKRRHHRRDPVRQ